MAWGLIGTDMLVDLHVHVVEHERSYVASTPSSRESGPLTFLGTLTQVGSADCSRPVASSREACEDLLF